MTTRKSLLERVEITSPCAANWDEMKGTDQIRYCSECQKYVYNLSEMTRREAESLLVSRGDQMCARMIRDLDGRTLTVESLPPVRLLGWKPGPVTSAVVSALISITPATAPLANGQVSSTPSHLQDGSNHKTHRTAPGSATSTITGIVSNETGAPMPGAVVRLTSEASGEALSQLTSEEGEFRFDGLAARTYIVEIQAKDYESVKHHDFVLQQGEARRLDVGMEKLILVMGATARPAQPLRTLYLDSDRVVVAEVGRTVDSEREGQLRTSLSVSQTIKGDGHKTTIDVYHWGYDEGRLVEGETVLVFLQRRDDSRGDKNRYDLIYGATSAKHLSPSELQTYLQRLQELKAITTEPGDEQNNNIAEWLVRCAEDPMTRREGAFELNVSARREQYEKEQEDRGTAGEFLNSLRRRARAQGPLFAALLTIEQKQRLVNAFLKSEDLDNDGDSELIELLRRWNDPRLLPFLMSHLRRFETTAPESGWRVLQTVAELLDDRTLAALSRRYLFSDPGDGLEADQSEVTNEDSEDVESDEVEAANEDEETDTSDDEVDAEAKLTPEAARQIRVDILKRFLEVAETRMKLAPAK